MVFLSIVAHLIGIPFGRDGEQSIKLHYAELGALLICWLVYWCGLLIYLSSLHPDTSGINLTSTLLTGLVIASVAVYNVLIIVYFVKVR